MDREAQEVEAQFIAKLDGCKRTNYRNQTFYHPVDDIKAWMLAERTRGDGIKASNVGILLSMVYSKTDGFDRARPESMHSSLIVFAILLRLGHGHLIHIFQQHIQDNNIGEILSTEHLLHVLRQSGVSSVRRLLVDFDREKWAFTPASLEDIVTRNKTFVGSRWVMPFCKRRSVGEGNIAAVEGVLVQEDLVPGSLKERLSRLDPQRGYEFLDEDFGLVSATFHLDACGVSRTL